MAMDHMPSVVPARSQAASSRPFRDIIDHFARRYPARLAILIFALIIGFFTTLLALPAATASGEPAPFIDALFNATSAVCVTGLVTVNTAVYWSTFGHVVIACAMKVGGLGVMTLASILGLAVSRHLGLTQRILTATETKSRLGEVGSLTRAVIITSCTVEAVLAAVLLPTFIHRGEPFIEALWHSIFMALSIFNNAGFVIVNGGMEQFVGSWAIGLPVIFGTMLGAIGFPVFLNVWTTKSIKHWSLHTKLTIVTYLILFAITAVLIALLEWGNPNTLAGLPLPDEVLAVLFQATTPRSSGLSTLNIGEMNDATWFLMDSMMFIGGGSASTAGGIKVSTFAVLILAIVAEARGDRDVEAFGKRIPRDVLRLAIAAAFLGAFMVGIGTILILQFTHFPLENVLFEVISAFATCGLSTGITHILPASAKTVLIVLMYAGRVGTMTVAAALALRTRRRVIRLPEERPVIG